MSMIQTKSFRLATYSQGDETSEKFALVIPGKVDSKDFAHMHSHVEYLASKGFHAVSFDPPGTWESEGDFSLYTMTNYFKAIDEVIEYFGNKKTLLVGHSRGAKITYIAGTRNPYIVAYAAIMGRLPEKEDIKQVDEKWQRDGYHSTLRALPPGTGPRVKEFRLPYAFYEDEITYYLTPEIRNCTKPKMLVLGKKDTIVLPEQVQKVYAALSEPKELHEVDSDHDYWLYPEIIDEINTLLGNFVEKYFLDK